MVMKLDSMSKNIVNALSNLPRNDALCKLLLDDSKSPFTMGGITDQMRKDMVKPSNPNAKILPYPFDIEAEVKDTSFIRVYYNNGEFDSSEAIVQSDIFIDIIVAKSLWLIDNASTSLKPTQSMIRPYEILGHVVKMVSMPPINFEVQGFQHLVINSKFDAIRLYCGYMSVET